LTCEEGFYGEQIFEINAKTPTIVGAFVPGTGIATY
jgi:hypothetical protein